MGRLHHIRKLKAANFGFKKKDPKDYDRPPTGDDDRVKPLIVPPKKKQKASSTPGRPSSGTPPHCSCAKPQFKSLSKTEEKRKAEKGCFFFFFFFFC
jgi:hypothetical protein